MISSGMPMSFTKRSDDQQLLIVLLAKDGDVRLHQTQQASDNARHAVEVSRLSFDRKSRRSRRAS